LYCYFIELATNLQNCFGILCYITSNSYLKAEYGFPLRKLLLNQNSLLQIINVKDYQVFDSAIVNSAVFISQNKVKGFYPGCIIVNSIYDGNMPFASFIDENKHFYLQNEFDVRSWSLANRNTLLLKQKIETVGPTLEELGTQIRLGIATGANYALIINEETKAQLISRSKHNEDIIKPILRGRDIFRYYYLEPSLYILLTKNGINVKFEYPNVYDYLNTFGKKFKTRGARGNHWANLRACSFFDDFQNEKIIWIELTDKGRFALCNDEIYLLNTAYFLLPPPQISARYLLGILNSKLIQFYLSIIAGTSGMGTLRWINVYVKRFPIPQKQTNDQLSLIALTDQILSLKKSNPQADTSALEAEIDRMVYELYGLTEEEIAIIEESVREEIIGG
jgi:adenine-specific DNA-methyltransferase